MDVPKIALITDLGQCSAATKLRDLAFDGRVRLVQHFEELAAGVVEINADLLAQCDAVVCRVADPWQLKLSDLGKANRPFWVASISTGADDLTLLADLPDVKILTSNSGNARGTAELAFFLVNELCRGIQAGARTIGLGSFARTRIQLATRLEGKAWMTLGSGAHVRELLGRAVPFGLKRIVIWNDRITAEKLKACLKHVAGKVDEITEVDGRFEAIVEVSRSDAEPDYIEIVGTKDIAAIEAADIVTIHLPPVAADDETGRSGTIGLVDGELISRMKRGAILVNVARGEILDGDDAENAIIDALENKRLGGFAADVLSKAAEKNNDPELSPIWTRFRQQYIDLAIEQIRGSANERQRKNISDVFDEIQATEGLSGRSPLNLILTPHIGGVTDLDFCNVAAEVTDRLLQKLGVG